MGRDIDYESLYEDATRDIKLRETWLKVTCRMLSKKQLASLPELNGWWEHQLLEEARIEKRQKERDEAEQLKIRALTKLMDTLSPEERKALGFK